MTSREWLLRVGFLSDAGRERERNEDALSVYVPYRNEASATAFDAVLLVADGLGGHAAGDAASRFVAVRIMDRLTGPEADDLTDPSPTDALRALVRRVDRELRTHIEALGTKNAGSTLTLAALGGSNLYVAHVGDSRLYRLREGELEQITRDHSWVAEQVRAGVISAEEAMTHPKRNLLTQCLGIGEPPSVSTLHVELHVGDRYLLCSDGLHAVVPDSVTQRVLDEEASPQHAANRLVAIANQAGGPDNITVVVFDVHPAGGMVLTEPGRDAATTLPPDAATPPALAAAATPPAGAAPAAVGAPAAAATPSWLARGLVGAGVVLTLAAAGLGAQHFLGPADDHANSVAIPEEPILRDIDQRSDAADAAVPAPPPAGNQPEPDSTRGEVTPTLEPGARR